MMRRGYARYAPFTPDTKYDILVLEPRRIFRAGDRGIVRRGNAIAHIIGRIVSAIVDQNAAP